MFLGNIKIVSWKYSKIGERAVWINFGGGGHITVTWFVDQKREYIPICQITGLRLTFSEWVSKKWVIFNKLTSNFTFWKNLLSISYNLTSDQFKRGGGTPSLIGNHDYQSFTKSGERSLSLLNWPVVMLLFSFYWDHYRYSKFYWNQWKFRLRCAVLDAFYSSESFAMVYWMSSLYWKNEYKVRIFKR